MAFDEGLAERIRVQLSETAGVAEKKMFGGLAFMVRGNMCVGILQSDLMARVGPDQYVSALDQQGAREMDFTGRPMKGMVMVEAAAIAEENDLGAWVARCLAFTDTLPTK